MGRQIVTLFLLSMPFCIQAETIPLKKSPYGTYSIWGSVDGENHEFLLDTGASTLSINSDLAKQLRKKGMLSEPGKVTGLMSSGGHVVMDTYKLSSFELVPGCDLGPVWVNVLPDTTRRNILGVNVLDKVAPFTIHNDPPRIEITGCEIVGG